MSTPDAVPEPPKLRHLCHRYRGEVDFHLVIPLTTDLLATFQARMALVRELQVGSPDLSFLSYRGELTVYQADGLRRLTPRDRAEVLEQFDAQVEAVKPEDGEHIVLEAFGITPPADAASNLDSVELCVGSDSVAWAAQTTAGNVVGTPRYDLATLQALVATEVALRWTQDRVRQYVVEQGRHCPFCNSQKVDGTGVVSVDEGTATYPVACSGCKREWNAVFLLKGVEVLDAAGEPEETIYAEED